ncbi:WSC domain-containing protein 1 [Mactra antiquata]
MYNEENMKKNEKIEPTADWTSNSSVSSGLIENTVNGANIRAHDLCTLRTPRLSERTLPRTALASFMGSGNTWTRHLIQQMSGIATASIYCDRHLRNGGFPFECYRDFTKVSVVKTHRTKNGIDQYDRAILLLRNPYDALISAVNWKYAGHVGHASDETVRKDMDKMFEALLGSYVKLVHLYIEKFEGPVLVLQYENMQDNLPDCLKELADFLQLSISQEDIDCTVHLQSGNFHRKSDPVARQHLLQSVFEGEREEQIREAMTEVENILQQKFNRPFKISKTLSELFNKLFGRNRINY